MWEATLQDGKIATESTHKWSDIKGSVEDLSIAILAQRLVRLICTNCKEAYQPEQKIILAANITEEMLEDRIFFKGRAAALVAAGAEPPRARQPSG